MLSNVSVCRIFILLVFMIGSANPARAQNWSNDARSIALGSGGTENVAGKMAQEEVQYKAIVIPLGLIQVLPDWSVFNPASDEFDPVRALDTRRARSTTSSAARPAAAARKRCSSTTSSTRN